MSIDEIPELPQFRYEELHEICQYEAMNQFLNAENKFMFYENEAGDLRFYFNKLDASLYAALIVKLSSPSNIKAFEFLKFVLEGVRSVKQATKKGHEIAVRIEKYIDKRV